MKTIAKPTLQFVMFVLNSKEHVLCKCHFINVTGDMIKKMH